MQAGARTCDSTPSPGSIPSLLVRASLFHFQQEIGIVTL